MRRLLFLILALFGALAIAFVAGRPPGPQPATIAADRFSAGRAMTLIGKIAAAPHPTGSNADASVRDILAGRLRALGLEVQFQATPLSGNSRKRLAAWREPAPLGLQAVNVVGVMPGQDRAQPAVLLMAHHDTVSGSPGAADDSAGVAAILEVLRALRTGPPPRRDVIVLFTDAEELGSDGAKAFFAANPLAKRVGAVVNLEARGGGGRALMFETGPDNGPMMVLFARAVHAPTALSPAVYVYKLLPNYTDFTIPKGRGMAGFNFAYLGRPELYHAPQATPAAIDAGTVQHMGSETLDLVRALAAAPVLPGRGPDAVFSDLFGLVLVAYPAWGGWVALAAAVALFGIAAARGRAAGMLEWRGVLQGAATGVGVLLVSAALLQLFNSVSGAGPHANYYDRLAAIPRLELQAGLVCLAVLALAVGPRRDDAKVLSGWLGLAALLAVVVAVLQALAPPTTPVFAWPLIAAAASAALVDPRDLGGCGTAAWRMVLIAAVGVAFVLGDAHLAFLGVGADMPGAMAMFLLFALVLIWPLLRGASPRLVGLWFALALLVTAGGLALWVRLDPPAATIPSYARALLVQQADKVPQP